VKKICVFHTLVCFFAAEVRFLFVTRSFIGNYCLITRCNVSIVYERVQVAAGYQWFNLQRHRYLNQPEHARTLRNELVSKSLNTDRV